MKTAEQTRKINQNIRRDSDTISQAMGEAQTHVPPRIMKKLIRRSKRRSR